VGRKEWEFDFLKLTGMETKMCSTGNGMGMGIAVWKWEGIGIKKALLHTSSYHIITSHHHIPTAFFCLPFLFHFYSFTNCCEVETYVNIHKDMVYALLL